MIEVSRDGRASVTLHFMYTYLIGSILNTFLQHFNKLEYLVSYFVFYLFINGNMPRKRLFSRNSIGEKISRDLF